MTFCTINGFNIPIEDRAAGADVDIFGRPARGITGSGEGSFFTSKRTFNLKTPIVQNADFLSYQGLINGEGHVMPLQENAFTADGIGPIASSTPVFTPTANKFDGGDYYMSSTGYILWYLPGSNPSQNIEGRKEGSGFTLCWVTEKSPSGHHIRAKTGYGQTTAISDDTDLYYEDGVSVASASKFNVIQLNYFGVYYLQYGTAEDKQLHELLYLPFRLTASQMETITTRTKRFSALPYIAVSGDIVGGETVTCIGTSGTSDFVPSTFSGVFGANNNLSFTLQEK